MHGARALLWLACLAPGAAFAPSARAARRFTRVRETAASDLESVMAEVNGMRAKEIQKELAERGVGYTDLFEKTDLAKRLAKVRLGEELEAGIPPPPRAPDAGVFEADFASDSVTGASSGAAAASEAPRKKKRKDSGPAIVDVEVEAVPVSDATSDNSGGGGGGGTDTAATAAPAGDKSFAEWKAELEPLRLRELTERCGAIGLSTTGLVEKAQVVDALARALADGATEKPQGGGFAEVEVVGDDAGPRPKQPEGAQQPNGGAGNPFGGGGNPFAGMGGGGGINLSDILGGMAGAGMGGMGGGGGGGNPFGGMGGMGGMGDMMNNPQMQQMLQKVMSDPSAMAAFQKASQNPKVMAAMQDVMQNPGNAAKYMNDPEIAPLLRDLEKFMK